MYVKSCNTQFLGLLFLSLSVRTQQVNTNLYCCGLSTATIEYSCPFVCLSVCVSICVCVCVHDNSKNNGSIHLKLEHIVVYENSSALCDKGQGHNMTLKFFSIYHSTNCHVLYLSFDTC